MTIEFCLPQTSTSVLEIHVLMEVLAMIKLGSSFVNVLLVMMEQIVKMVSKNNEHKSTNFLCRFCEEDLREQAINLHKGFNSFLVTIRKAVLAFDQSLNSSFQNNLHTKYSEALNNLTLTTHD